MDQPKPPKIRREEGMGLYNAVIFYFTSCVYTVIALVNAGTSDFPLITSSCSPSHVASYPLISVCCSWVGTRINSFLLLRNENAKIHRTEAYRTSQVVLRRGFDFLAQFQLAEEFNPDEHSLEVHLRRGSRPAYSRATHFVSRIGRKPSRSYQWAGSTMRTNGEVVTVAVKTPVDVPVGEYEVEAEVEHDGVSSKFVCQETVVFLFNPWHEGVCVHPPATTLICHRLMIA